MIYRILDTLFHLLIPGATLKLLCITVELAT